LVFPWPATMGVAAARYPNYLFGRPCRRMAKPDTIPDGFEACGSKEFREMECAQKRRSAAIVARGSAATLRAKRRARLDYRAARTGQGIPSRDCNDILAAARAAIPIDQS